ncbi:hypothetical protein MSG28_006439 [Choristoneura fumiferana]|uniref:Uncharacterized protein n=1 Tax=Choristoneura fumiferana TaxID=7141 RepID=A0ACC0JEZ8_CHOFU|nr:hypothetical protein MSG28_006439 [Choristoneura fumiferana]
MITFGAASTSTPQEDTGVEQSEVRSICESVCSDGSNATVQPGASNARPRMDIACVLDVTQSTNIAHRKRALEEVRLAADLVNGNLHHIHIVHLDGESHDDVEEVVDTDSVKFTVVSSSSSSARFRPPLGIRPFNLSPTRSTICLSSRPVLLSPQCDRTIEQAVCPHFFCLHWVSTPKRAYSTVRRVVGTCGRPKPISALRLCPTSTTLMRFLKNWFWTPWRSIMPSMTRSMLRCVTFNSWVIPAVNVHVSQAYIIAGSMH